MIRPDFFAHPQYPFTESVLADAGKHAAAEAPNESCGLVLAGKYVPCRNASAEPWHEFVIPKNVYRMAVVSGDLQGIIHSHPGGPWYPTKTDIESQIATGIPWAILVPGEDGAELACHWGGERPPVFDADGKHIPRKFRHYVADCFALMEDYYSEQGLSLPKVPRDWEWWKSGQTLYMDYLEASGFKVISTDPTEFARIARPGDAFLSAWRSPKTPNHAAAYLGKGEMLDHLPNRLSRVVAVQPYLRKVTHWLRHSDQ